MRLSPPPLAPSVEIAAFAPAPHNEPVKPGVWGGYSRSLTAGGGVRIAYRDLDLRWWVAPCRIAGVIILAIGALWLLCHLPLNAWIADLAIIGIGVGSWLAIRQPAKISRSLEVRPDCLIIDDKAVFWLQQIGDHRPAFEPSEEPDGLVLRGIYGTRHVEFTTSYRVDENDRTPDVLAADFANAVEQIWDRADFIPGMPS